MGLRRDFSAAAENAQVFASYYRSSVPGHLGLQIESHATCARSISFPRAAAGDHNNPSRRKCRNARVCQCSLVGPRFRRLFLLSDLLQFFGQTAIPLVFQRALTAVRVVAVPDAKVLQTLSPSSRRARKIGVMTDFPRGVKATMRTLRSCEDSARLTKPLATSRSTATLIDPGVRLTFGPITLTGSGPL